VERQLNRSAGVVSLAQRSGRSSIEASPYPARASGHPVCACASLGAASIEASP